MDMALLFPYSRKKALRAVDNGDTAALVQLYSFLAAQTHIGDSSEFDKAELKAHKKLLADRAIVAFLCPSAFPSTAESEAIYGVARCIFGFIAKILPEAEYLDSFLNLLVRKEISDNARLLMAKCLWKFLPEHPDIFQFDSLEKRIVSAMVGETGAIFRVLDETLVAVKKRFARAQAQSELE